MNNFSPHLPKNLCRLLLATVSLVACSQIVCQQVEARKEVRNLDSWSSWGQENPDDGGYTLSEEIEQKPHGGTGSKSSAKIQADRPHQPKGFASIFQDFAATKFAGKKVRFSASIKTDKVDGSAALWMMDKSGDKVLVFDDMSNRSLSGTHNWKKCSVVLDIPTESQQMRVGFMLRGGGTAWMRDPELVIASPTEKSTPLLFDSTKFKLDVLDPVPRNLTFSDPNYISENRNSISQWSVHTDLSAYEVRISHEVLDNGKPSLQVECKNEAKDKFATIYQNFDAANYLKKRVCFSADLKNSSDEDWTTMFMQINGAENILVFDALESSHPKSLKDWTKTKIVLDVPPESKKIRIGFLHAGKGKAWISNLSFETVGEEVPVTAKPGRKEKLPKEKLELKPDFRFD